jgi:gliding motility-associated-like protein
MKKWSTILFFLLANLLVSAQCFTIESILADACGNPEGENEMVLIKAHQNIDIDDLVFDWPNNSFLGWCADANLTTQLNQTITSSCGALIEPPLGIVPAGKKLLAVTSTNMQVNANSFTGLTDTLYIVYQCAGNTSGHFSNSASTPRTLTIDYTGNCNQSQSRSYLGSSLPGTDGGAVKYDSLGNETYFNTGCNAIVPNTSPNWDFPNRICEDVDILDLNEFLSANALPNGTWSGDIENGHFFNPASKLGVYSITYTVPDIGACLPSPDSTIQVVVSIPQSGPDTVIVCDSIKPYDDWLFEDTTIRVDITSNNEYKCDTTIFRSYIFITPDFELDNNKATIDYGETHEFEIIGAGNYTYEILNEGLVECATSCFNTVLEPDKTTLYSIVVIEDGNSCAANLKLKITVLYHPELNIPNTFTPNADGENDVFKIFGKDLASVQYAIYSKWGEIVFEGNDLEKFWDGNFKNKPVENGSYLLQLEAIGLDGISIKEVKSINLLR